MPWESADVSEQRVKFVVRAASGKESMTVLCRLFGISRTTGYRWRQRFEQAKSLAAVAERSRRPQHCPTRTAASRERQVMTLRREYGWGAKKLAVLLREQGAPLPVITVHRILKRHGLVRIKDTHAPALQRFEHKAPNQLWQMDGKGEYRGGEASCFPLSILDDHSRYLLGLYGLRAFTAEQVYPCLVRTFERYGLPEAMLMDRGSIWWGTKNGYGLTWLSVRLIEQGIELRYGRPHHPQTQGKVERLHRTLDEAMRYRGKPQRLAEWDAALEKFRRVYNELRPHEALRMQRPAERYRVSTRRYQRRPPRWEYPAGSTVCSLNDHGCLYWDKRNWFVCEALAGRRVQVEQVGKLLAVSYRHMYVREIDRARGCTYAMVWPRAVGKALRSPFGLPTRLPNRGNPES
jgi:transposase InsO family protein